MTSVVQSFLRGSCHCGALGFSFQTVLRKVTEELTGLAPESVPILSRPRRAYDIRFGRAAFIFMSATLTCLNAYRFGLKTADSSLLCRQKRCGVYVELKIETAHGAFGIKYQMS